MTAPWIAAFAVLWLTVVVMLVVVIGTVRRALAVLEADDSFEHDYHARSLQVTSMYGGAPPGTSVPQFMVRTAAGETVLANEFFVQPVLSVLVAAGCAPCKSLLSQLAASSESLEAQPIVFADDLRDSRYASLPPSVTVLEQIDGSASKAFQSNAFPQAFALDEHGVVRAVAIPNSLADLRRLARAVEGGDRRERVTQTAAA